MPEGFLCWWERASDISFILDDLSQYGPLAQRLDVEKFCGVGFSLGAHTMLSLAGAITHMPLFESWASGNGRHASGPREFPRLADEVDRLMQTSEQFRTSWQLQGQSYKDNRLDALVLLAPAPPVRAFRSETVAALQIPVTILAGKGDQEAPFEDCAQWLSKQNPRFRVKLLADEAGHYVFLPEATSMGVRAEPELCLDAPTVDRYAIHEHAASICAAAFLKT